MSYLRTPLLATVALFAVALAASLAVSEFACANAASPAPVLLPLVPTEPAGREPITSPFVEPTSAQPGAQPAPVTRKDTPATAPPGLVLIPGGRTVIGSSLKDIEDMLEENSRERAFAGAYISETPQFKREINEFALMVTEVTNEQFAAYIRSSGGKPPEAWGQEAITAAGQIFLKEQGERREKAKQEGRPIPDREKFDGQAWWEANWKEAEWAVPKGTEHKPVVFVSHTDAENYARWAGLRLPSEFEFARAVRGKTDHYYPWGEDWKKDHAVTSEQKGPAETAVVGSFPMGANEQGVHDLIGNVWEWTSSPYVAFPKYKEKTWRFGKGKDKDEVSALANWDANKRVSVGGGYHANRFIARGTTRRGASRDQTADSLGFRCAASLEPGIDIADRVMTDELDASSRPTNPEGAVQYAGPDTLAADRWQTKPLGADERPVPGYEVITGYDYVIFTPVDKIYSVDVNDLKKSIIEDGPAPIGFLSTNQRLLQPDLQPGTYMISYRCAGKRRAEKDDKQEEDEEGEPEIKDTWDLGNYEVELGLDPSKGYFLFFNSRAEIMGFVEAIDFDKKSGQIKSPGSASFFEKTYTKKEPGEDGKDIEVEVTEKWLRFDANIRARAQRRGFIAAIGLQVENELDTTSFRMTQGE
jgi:formylglycine-generating enzyme required for sulfatase activity